MTGRERERVTESDLDTERHADRHNYRDSDRERQKLTDRQ